MAEQSHGWRGSRPTPPLVNARSGGPVESPLADGHRFELSIYETPTGYRLLIIDWADESQADSEHATLDAAKERASTVVHEDGLDWEAWTPPEEDGA